MRIVALLIMAAIPGIPQPIYERVFTLDIQLQANEGRSWHNVHRSSAGNWYAIQTWNRGGSNPVVVLALKSTDDGASWNPIDNGTSGSPNGPITCRNNTHILSQRHSGLDTIRIGDTIHVFYVKHAAPGVLAHMPFDMATDTWGSETVSTHTPEISGLNGAATPRFGIQRPIYAELQDNGYIRLFWTDLEDVTGTYYIRTLTCAFNPGTPGFSAQTFLVNSGVASNDVISQSFYADGKTHVVTMATTFLTSPTAGNWAIKHVSIDDAGTVNTYTTIATDGSRDDESAIGPLSFIGGVLYFIYAAGDDSNGLGSEQGGTQSLKLAFATEATNPTWSTETVSATYEPYNGHDPVGNSHPGSVISRNSNVEIWYSTEYADIVNNAPNCLLRIQRDGAGSYSNETFVRESLGVLDVASLYTASLSGQHPLLDQPDSRLWMFWIDLFHPQQTTTGYLFVYDQASAVAASGSNYGFFQ